MAASTVGDVVWLVVWGSLYVLVWAVQIVRYRCCHRPPAEERRPTYGEKLRHDHLVLGVFCVHPDDPFTRGARVFILVFNAATVLTLTSIQFDDSGCIEEEGINWSLNFAVRVVQGAITSMLLVWLFRFEAVLDWVRRRRVEPCCLCDLITFLTLLIVLPILLSFCSDFYHQCALGFVMLKWGVALALEYLVAQPAMVWVELNVFKKYDIFHPRTGGRDDEYSVTTEPEVTFLEEEDDDDFGLRRDLASSELTPLKHDIVSPRFLT